MNNKPIGLFDSGIGGLSVLKELINILPNEDYIYLGDTQNFPYGNKSKEAIIELAKKNIEFLISKNVKLIIIACGTVTSQALDEIKNDYNIPIIGIINPTIDYLISNHKDNEKIGIIATSGTIKSGVWEKKINDSINNVKLISEQAPLLAIMAETGWTNNKVAKYTIKEYMKTFKNVDKLILGCTHYPFFEDLIRKEIPHSEIINTGVIVSKYIEKYLNNNKIINNSKKGSFDIYLTDKEDNFKSIAEQFLNIKIKENQIRATFINFGNLIFYPPI